MERIYVLRYRTVNFRKEFINGINSLYIFRLNCIYFVPYLDIDRSAMKQVRSGRSIQIGYHGNSFPHVWAYCTRQFSPASEHFWRQRLQRGAPNRLTLLLDWTKTHHTMDKGSRVFSLYMENSLVVIVHDVFLQNKHVLQYFAYILLRI